MSMLMPLGKSNSRWFGLFKDQKEEKSEKLEKTASVDQDVQKEQEDPRDALYDIAKSVVDNMKKQSMMYDEDLSVLDVEEVPEGVEEEVSVLEEGEKTEADIIDKVQDAVEKIEDAVEDLEEVAEGEAREDLAEEAEEAEIEVEIEEEPQEEEEIIVESEDDDAVNQVEEMEELKTEEGCGVMAASEEEFVKFAKLSDKTKKEVREYWISLGFPQDYVDVWTSE